MQITGKHMKELRGLVERGEQPSPMACGVFVRLGLAHRASLREGVQATAKGKELVAEHVGRTGDGPEGLKNLLGM